MRSCKRMLLVIPLIMGFGVRLPAAEPPPPITASGEETRRWLELQRSGAAASPRPKTVSGPVADEIYQRYKKSFTHEIPDFFKVERGTSTGSTR